MRLLLLGKEKLEYILLPEKKEDGVSITKAFDSLEEYPIIVDSENSNWVLKSTDKLKIVNNNTFALAVALKEYNYYVLNCIGTEKNILLYCFPENDLNTYSFKTNDLNQIKVGNTENCDILYNQASILIEKVSNDNSNYWQLTNQEINYKLYVNGESVEKCNLKVGDIIFCNGLKIIWMGNFFNVNNPNNSVRIPNLPQYKNESLNTNYTPVDDEDITLYNEKDYFYHTLRIDNNNKREYIQIESVESEKATDELPFILSIGSSITMVGSSFMMFYTVMYSLSSGRKTLLESLPQIIMFLCMLIGSLLLPKITARYQKKQSKKKEQLKIRKYTEYLNEKYKQIQEIKRTQEQNLNDNNPTATDCFQLLTSTEKINNVRFWCRTITDDDFLTIRLGTGECESNIEVSAPERHFTLEEDKLLEQAYQIAEESKVLHNIPITLSLIENSITGLIINSNMQKEYVDNIILQLVTLHSPIDLKIVVLTNEKNKKRWDYIKYLPHCWSDDKETRYFASTLDEINELSSYLEEEYKLRNSNQKQGSPERTEAVEEEYSKNQSYKKYEPYYLIINDDYGLAKNSIIVDLLLKTSINYGFSYLCIGNKMKELPSKCGAFIEVLEKNGTVIDNDESETGRTILKFENEPLKNINMRLISNKLANIPVLTKDGISVLPNSLSFLEMLRVSKIEQLDIPTRWKNNNPVVSLATTIGVHTNGDDFKLDLHEKFHGPHGLIAGSTGSGKSEFIITFILSMAANYHPYEVQFVLIDYKGGGLAGAFENKETGVRIPHLIGTITNLDTAEMNRTLVSIESELKRRQRIFNEVRDQLDEGTIDIYKYQRLYREGAVSEPMAHLFIISDEFAELKAQQPEFMQQLIQTARIGRSLGVHLILATQKPSGVVNDQIWSNSKFKVCLKVQDRSDSMEMLKRPEAASIKETGRFYLQVGYNDYFDIGQSGWSGAKYIPTDRIIKKIDDSISIINNVGYSIKNIKDTIKVDTAENLGEQLTNVVKYIYDLGIKENIKTNKLWLDALSPEIYISNLKLKYNYKPTSYYINPVIGEYDNPRNQEQSILNLDLTNNGNTIIYGQTGSGKELLLSTIVWSCIAEHTPEEVNIYIIDCGAETLKMFNNIPHVGDIATIETPDLIYDMFEMAYKEIERRKDLFADYAGSYTEYINNSGKKLPLMIFMINNYEIFVENFGKLSESVQNLYRDGSKYGIVFIISAVSTTAIRGRMVQSFNNIVCLQIPNESEYRTLLNAPRGLFPSKVYGRGIVGMNDTAYEFQTAMFTQRKDMVNVVRQASEKLNAAYTTRAKKIPVLPDNVTTELYNEYDSKLDKLPIGFDINDKKIFTYNFTSQIIQILTGAMTDERFAFVESTIELISTIPSTKIRIIDFAKAYQRINENIQVYNENYDQAFIEINNEIMQNKNTSEEYYYYFLGIGQVRKMISPEVLPILDNIFTNLSGILNIHIILVDVYDTYRNLQLETWYQTFVNPMYGIWLGNEVENQLVINIPQLSMEDRKINFPCMAYAVDNGKYTIIKHTTKKEDNNEE